MLVAIQQNGQNADFHAVLGQVLIKNNEIDEAKKELAAAERLSPENANAKECKKTLDRYEELITHLTQNNR